MKARIPLLVRASLALQVMRGDIVEARVEADERGTRTTLTFAGNIMKATI